MTQHTPPLTYRVLRAIMRHTLRVFFRRLEIEGEENVPPTGPLLIAPNHPNTLVDVLMTATVVERHIRFVAKSTVVAIPVVGSFLKAMGTVPIHRREDGGGEVSEDKQKANAGVLAACEEVVAGGGAVLIFPEGKSDQASMKLYRLRTGLARIALGAEERAPGQVQILPVALVYEDPGKFRSAVRVRIGAPIQVAPFAATRAGPDDFAPARSLTSAVRDALELDVVHVEDEANEELVRELDLLYGSAIASEAGGRLAASKALARAVNHFAQADPERVSAMRQALVAYREALDAAGLSDRAVRQRSIPRPTLGQDVLFYLGAPVALWGLLNHLVLYQLPRLAVAQLNLRMEFDSTVKLLVGIVSFVATYVVQTWVVAQLAGATGALVYLLTLPVSGVLCLLWLEGLAWRRRVARAARLRQGASAEILTPLEAQRAGIIRELDRARVAWLARQLEAAEEFPVV